MAKRFTDTDKWKMAWYRKLGSEGRDLWNYLHDACDAAGLLEVDLERMSFELGFRVTMERIKSVLRGKLVVVSSDRIFLPAFIEFQYGELSESVRPHQSVIKKLKNQGVWEGYLKGIHTLKDKEQEQEQEQDKEKDKEQEEEKEVRTPKVKASAISLSPAPQSLVSPEIVKSCGKTWLSTLAHFKQPRAFLLPAEEQAITRAIIENKNAEIVDLALYGARYEPGFDGWNPREHVDITRVLLKDKEGKPRIQKYVGYGVQARQKESERRQHEQNMRDADAAAIADLEERAMIEQDPEKIRAIIDGVLGHKSEELIKPNAPEVQAECDEHVRKRGHA